MVQAPIPTPRTIQDYFALMDAFASGNLDAATFERSFLDLFQNDATFHPPKVFAVLEDVFLAVDAYYPDPALRDEGDLDEDQLRERVRMALGTLQQLLSPA